MSAAHLTDLTSSKKAPKGDSLHSVNLFHMDVGQLLNLDSKALCSSPPIRLLSLSLQGFLHIFFLGVPALALSPTPAEISPSKPFS